MVEVRSNSAELAGYFSVLTDEFRSSVGRGDSEGARIALTEMEEVAIGREELEAAVVRLGAVFYGGADALKNVTALQPMNLMSASVVDVARTASGSLEVAHLTIVAEMLIAFRMLYGDPSNFPPEVNSALGAILNNIGYTTMEGALYNALNILRLREETHFAGQVVVSILKESELYAGVAESVESQMQSGIVPESAARAGIGFALAPENLFLPIVAGRAVAGITSGTMARLAQYSGVTEEALIALSEAVHLVTESAVFTVAAKGVHTAKGEQVDWSPESIAKETLASTAVFGMLRGGGHIGEELASAISATNFSGLIAKMSVPHTTSILSLSLTDKLQEAAGIVPESDDPRFIATIWRSAFLHLVMAAAGEVKGIGNIRETKGLSREARLILTQVLAWADAKGISITTPRDLVLAMASAGHPPLYPLPSAKPIGGQAREGKAGELAVANEAVATLPAGVLAEKLQQRPSSKGVKRQDEARQTIQKWGEGPKERPDDTHTGPVANLRASTSEVFDVVSARLRERIEECKTRPDSLSDREEIERLERLNERLIILSAEMDTAFFGADDLAGEVLRLTELSNEELHETANASKAREILFRSRFFAGAITDLLADIETTKVVEDGIELVGRFALDQSGGMTLLGRLRSLNARTGGTTDVWRLDTRSGNTIYVEPSDPTAPELKERLAALMKRSGKGWLEFGEEATLRLMREMQMTIDALEGSTPYAELAGAYRIVQQWLSDNIVYFSDIRSVEDHNIIDWENPDTLVLIQALYVIKRDAPHFFIEMLGFNAKPMESESPYFGNILQKALANVLKRVSVGRDHAVAGSEDLAAAYYLVKVQLDNLLTMNRRVVLYGRDICEAIISGAQDAIMSEPEESRAAAAAFWMVSAAASAMFEAKLSRARGGELVEMETELERVLGITAESIADPILVLKFLSKAPVALLKRARINTRLAEIFGTDAMDDLEKFQKVCVGYPNRGYTSFAYMKYYQSLIGRIPITIAESSGRVVINPVFKKHGIEVAKWTVTTPSTESREISVRVRTGNKFFHDFLQKPSKNAVKLMEEGMDRFSADDAKLLGDIHWPFLVAQYLLTSYGRKGKFGDLPNGKPFYRHRENWASFGEAVGWARRMSGKPSLEIGEVEVVKSMLASSKSAQEFSIYLPEILAAVAGKKMDEIFNIVLNHATGGKKLDIEYFSLLNRKLVDRNRVTCDSPLHQVSQDMRDRFVRIFKERFLPSIPTVTYRSEATISDTRISRGIFTDDFEPKRRVASEDIIVKAIEEGDADLIEAFMTAPNFRRIILKNPQKFFSVIARSEFAIPFFLDRFSGGPEKGRIYSGAPGEFISEEDRSRWIEIMIETRPDLEERIREQASHLFENLNIVPEIRI